MTVGERRVHLSLSDAFRISYNHLVRRLGRSALNIASIALGLSFYTSLLFTDAFYQTHAALGGARLNVEQTYYWLVAIALIVSVVGITNAMLISVVNRDSGTTVDFNNVEINGWSLGDFSGVSWKDWTVSWDGFDDSWTLTGEIELAGTFSGSSELSKVQIVVGQHT